MPVQIHFIDNNPIGFNEMNLSLHKLPNYLVANPRINPVLMTPQYPAAQALTFRRPLKTSAYLERFVDTFIKTVPFIEDKRVLLYDIENAKNILKEIELPA